MKWPWTRERTGESEMVEVAGLHVLVTSNVSSTPASDVAVADIVVEATPNGARIEKNTGLAEVVELVPKSERGLFGKFFVDRVDGRDRPGGDKHGARYFVLDYMHDPIARVALRAYIEECRSRGMFLALADDLNDELTDTRHTHLEVRSEGR